MVILDTNILIDHMRLQEARESLMEKIISEKDNEEFGISIISLQEMYQGKSTRGKNEEARLISILSYLKILPYEYEVARLAGEIVRDSKNILEFADAAIAATAIINNSSLATLNIKDFVQIPGLDILKLDN